MQLKRMVAIGATVAMTTVGVVSVVAGPSDAHRLVAKANLIDGTGAKVGTARFIAHRGDLVARVHVHLPADSPVFHGMHVHANADGTGCVPGTGFTGVGGHWDLSASTHGNHTGDLPSVVREADGSADIEFRIDRFTATQLIGKAVIVHAGPDNFGNVPLGAAANQYTDNGTAYNGTGGTAATGNAGARYACGVITAR